MIPEFFLFRNRSEKVIAVKATIEFILSLEIEEILQPKRQFQFLIKLKLLVKIFVIANFMRSDLVINQYL